MTDVANPEGELSAVRDLSLNLDILDPEERDSWRLPEWAWGLFAARCAQRALCVYTYQPRFRPAEARMADARPVLEQAVESCLIAHIRNSADSKRIAAETSAAVNAIASQLSPVRPDVVRFYAVKAAGLACQVLVNPITEDTTEVINEIADDVIHISEFIYVDMGQDKGGAYARSADAVWHDIWAIREMVRQGYDAESSAKYFDFFSRFDIDADVAPFGGSVVSVGALLTERFAQHLISDRNRLYQLNPRQFEELVASIFDNFGFVVELTARTRDGGYDVMAVKDGHIGVHKYLIECKRYTPPNTVGVGVVRNLGGVILGGAGGRPRGILATTSYFTSDAKDYLDVHRLELTGRDIDGLVDWLKIYRRIQAVRSMGIEPSELTLL